MKANIWKRNIQPLMLGLVLVWAYSFSPTLLDIYKDYQIYSLNWHCYLVLPLAIFLLIHKSSVFMRISPATSFLGFVFFLLLASTWLVADYYNKPELQQVVTILIMPVIVWSLCGYKIFKALNFPLCYLLFALPINSRLIPYLEIIWESNISAFLYMLPSFSHDQNVITLLSDIVSSFQETLAAISPAFAIGVFISYCVAFTRKNKFYSSVAYLLLPYACVLLGAVGVIGLHFVAPMFNFTVSQIKFIAWFCFTIGALGATMYTLVYRGDKVTSDSLKTLDWQSSWQQRNKGGLQYTLLVIVLLLAMPYIHNKVVHGDFKYNVLNQKKVS